MELSSRTAFHVNWIPTGLAQIKNGRHEIARALDDVIACKECEASRVIALVVHVSDLLNENDLGTLLHL